MRFHSFKHHYHDSQLCSFVLGPRREITLRVSVLVWRAGPRADLVQVSIRFGNIKNYEEVAAYFQKLPAANPNGFIGEIMALVPPKEKSCGFVLDIEYHGSIEIHSDHVTEA